MTSEAYLDLGGRAERRWPPAYNEVIGLHCPRHLAAPPSMRGCGAKPGEVCTNAITGRARKAPCYARMRALHSPYAPVDLDGPPAPRTAGSHAAPVGA